MLPLPVTFAPLEWFCNDVCCKNCPVDPVSHFGGRTNQPLAAVQTEHKTVKHAKKCSIFLVSLNSGLATVTMNAGPSLEQKETCNGNR